MSAAAVTSFPSLARPLILRGMSIRNRIFMGPHQSQLGTADGLPPAALHDYLVARAAGGAGLLITEGGVVRSNSLRERTVLRAYADETTERWKPIVSAVHAQGAHIVAQILHSGRQASNYSHLDEPLWAPSAIACPSFRETPKEMEHHDIDALLDDFARCTANIRAAGFDGVEVQCCHGYLLNEFLSPYTNFREDHYGGSLDNRMRLLLETVTRVRQQIGDDRLLGVRLESRELVPGGLDLDESTQVAQALERTGLVDYLSVSQGVREVAEMIRAPMFVPMGYAIDWTAAIKRAVHNIPVFATGRMPIPEIAERAVAEGKADAVVITREFIADPDYAIKALSGRADEIRRCVATLDCVFNVGAGRPLKCTYNAEIGKEGQGKLAPAPHPKKVVVVGGGPAGLEAARVAALRGHHVTLFEASDALGGDIRLAAATPARDEMAAMIRYWEVQLERTGVVVHLGTRVSTLQLLQLQPDEIVVATGAEPLMPPSRMLPRLHIEPGAQLMSYRDALAATWTKGQRVVIYDGELHAMCMGVADQLAHQGVEVLFVTESERPAMRLDAQTAKMWFKRLGTQGVQLLPFRRLEQVTSSAAQVKHLHSDQLELLPCDVVVYAYARRASNTLYRELKSAGLSVRAVGDCLAPRSVMFAVNDGFEAGAAL